MATKTYLDEKEYANFSKGFKEVQQVLADMKYEGLAENLVNELDKALQAIGSAVFETDIPESPEPRRDRSLDHS